MHPVAQKILEYGKPTAREHFLLLRGCSRISTGLPCIIPTWAPLAGYGETYGKERVLETFQTFLAAKDQNASQLKLTDANIGEFLNFFLEQHEGGMPSELDMEEDSTPEGIFEISWALLASESPASSIQPRLSFSSCTAISYCCAPH